MGAIDTSITNTGIAIDCQPYIEILEKTNQQLSLWLNPYGLMIGILTFLIAVLAFGLSIFIYRAGRDFKKQTTQMVEEATLETKGQQKLFDEQIKKSVEYIQKIEGKELTKQLADIQMQKLRQKKESIKLEIPKNSIIESQTLGFRYWYAENGVRHTFPTEDVFNSWFPPSGFKPVVFRLSDQQVASILLGGNVVYKAGTRIITTQDDDRMYVTDHTGLKHHLTSKKIAEDIFGSAWEAKIVEIPNVLLSDYEDGDPIAKKEDFSLQREIFLSKLY